MLVQASGTVPIGRENCQRDSQTIPPTSFRQVSRCKYTVILLLRNKSPLLTIAAHTLSLFSQTAAALIWIWIWGRLGDLSTFTVINGALTPTSGLE